LAPTHRFLEAAVSSALERASLTNALSNTLDEGEPARQVGHGSPVLEGIGI
jgi:hypothetical protein